MPLDASPGTTFQTTIAGEAYTFWYGLRAWLELKVNALKRSEIKAYLDNMDIVGAAAFARAGVLWMYRKGEDREGQEPPSVDFFIDHLDVPKFMSLFGDSQTTSGLVKPVDEAAAPEEASDSADPSMA